MVATGTRRYTTLCCSIRQFKEVNEIKFEIVHTGNQAIHVKNHCWQSFFISVYINNQYHMKKVMFSAAFAALIGLATAQAQTTDSTQTQTAAQPTQAAAPSGDVTQAIAASGYNASLATAIKTAGLESTLKGSGPFTVFAPSDQAFASVPAGDSLLTQQPKLAATLKNHIVSGKYTKDDIIKALTAGKGVATLNTIEGGTVTLKVNENKNLELSDASGNKALVTVFDVQGTNGTVHVINNVLVPKQ